MGGQKPTQGDAIKVIAAANSALDYLKELQVEAHLDLRASPPVIVLGIGWAVKRLAGELGLADDLPTPVCAPDIDPDPVQQAVDDMADRRMDRASPAPEVAGAPVLVPALPSLPKPAPVPLHAQAAARQKRQEWTEGLLCDVVQRVAVEMAQSGRVKRHAFDVVGLAIGRSSKALEIAFARYRLNDRLSDALAALQSVPAADVAEMREWDGADDMTLLRGRVAVAPWGMIAKGLERSIIDCQRRLDVLTQFDPKTGARGRSAKAALDIAQKAM